MKWLLAIALCAFTTPALAQNSIKIAITGPFTGGSASMTQWAKPDGPKDLFMFRFAAHDGIQAAMVVEEAIARKFTKVAIFADATNYGVSGRNDLVEQIKKQGN